MTQTPSPVEISEERVERLMCDHSVRFDSLHDQTKDLKQGCYDHTHTSTTILLRVVQIVLGVPGAVLLKPPFSCWL